jgi:hypothetical protein
MPDFAIQTTLIDEIKDKDVEAYEGEIQSTYLNSDTDFAVDEVAGCDNTEISSSGGSTQSQSVGNTDNSNPAEESSNYIENTDNSSDPTPPSPPPPPNNSGGTGSSTGDNDVIPDGGYTGDGSAVDIAGGIDDAIGGLEDEFSDFDNFYDEHTTDEFGYDYESGYWTLNPEKIERILSRLTNLFGLLTLISLYYDTKADIFNRLQDAFSSLPPDENRGKQTNVAQVISEAREAIMKNFLKAVMLVAERIQAHNDNEYNEQLEYAETLSTEVGKFDRIVSSGIKDPDEERKLELVEQAHRWYEEAQKKTVANLQAVISEATFHGFTIKRPSSVDSDPVIDREGPNMGNGKGGINPTANGTVEFDLDEEGDQIFNSLTNADSYTVYDKDGYIDLNKSKEWLVNLRGVLTSLLNMQKMYAAVQVNREEVVRMWTETFSGKDAGQTKTKLAESIVETEASHTTSLFDQYASIHLQSQKHNIEARYYRKQLQKLKKADKAKTAAVVLTYLSVVIAAAATACVTAGASIAALAAAAVALGAGLGAGLSSYAGTKYADVTVRDEYTPTELPVGDLLSDGNRASRRQLGNSFSTTAAELEIEQREIERNLNSSLLTKVSDGYYSVEFSRLAAISQQMAAVNDALRLIKNVQRQQMAMVRGFSRAFSRTRSASTSQLLLSAVEASIAQSDTRFQSLSSYINEVVQGKNWERSQEIAMEKATFQMAFSMFMTVVGAMVGGVAGGGMGALLGASLGNSIGAAIARFVSAYKGPNGNVEACSYNVGFTPDTSDFDKSYRRGESAGLIRSIDADISQIHSDLLDFNRSIASAGKGTFGSEFSGVNSDYVSGLREQLNTLHHALLLIVANTKTRSKVTANLARAFGSSTSEIEADVNVVMKKLAADNSTFSNLTRLVLEKVQVKNRAAAAREEAISSGVSMGITVGVSVVGIALGGAVNKALFSLISPVISVANSMFQLGVSIDKAINGDYGDFSNYLVVPEEKESENNRGRYGDDEDIAINAARELDKLQTDLLNINGSHMVSAGFGNKATDMATISENQIGIKQTYRILEALNNVRKLMSKVNARVRRSGSMGTGMVDSMLQANEQNAFNQLDTQVQGLRNVVQKHNEMKRAERQAAVAGFQAALAVVVLGISAKMTSLKMKNANIQKNLTKQNGNTRTQNQKTMTKNVKKMKQLAWVSAAMRILQAITTNVVAKIFDKKQGTSEIAKKAAEEQLTRAVNSEAKANNDFAAQVGAFEATTDALNSNIGALKTEIESHKAMPDTTQEDAQTFGDTLKSTKDSAEELAPYYKKNGLKNPVFTRDHERAKRIRERQGAQGAQTPQTQPPPVAVPPQQTDPNNRANLQRAYVENILEKAASQARTNPTRTPAEQQINRAQLQAATQGGKKLEKMNAQELQLAYENLYKKVFVPLRNKMRALMAKRVAIQHRITALTNNTSIDPAKKAILIKKAKAELAACMQTIESVKGEIKAYHKLVGSISGLLRSKYRKELTQVRQPAVEPRTQTRTRAPAVANRPAILSRIQAAAKRRRARQVTPAVTTPPVATPAPAVTPVAQPQSNPSTSTSALLTRANKLLQQSAAQMTQVDQVAAQVSTAGRAKVELNNIRGRSETDLTRLLSAAKTQHQAAVQAHTAVVKVNQGIHTEMGNNSAMIKQVDKQITALEKQLKTAGGTQAVVVRDQIRRLKKIRQELLTRKGQLTAKAKVAKAKVREAMSNMQKAAGAVSKIKGEIDRRARAGARPQGENTRLALNTNIATGTSHYDKYKRAQSEEQMVEDGLKLGKMQVSC